MKRNSRNKIKTYAFAIVTLFMIIMAASEIFAGEKTSGYFNTNVTYDVYCSAGDGQLSIIKNVKVIGPVNIQEVSFLVVMSTGLQSYEGYIQLENIVAILPAGQVVESKK